MKFRKRRVRITDREKEKLMDRFEISLVEEKFDSRKRKENRNYSNWSTEDRTRNKITELLNKTVVDKGRGRRRDSVKNTDLSSFIDSKAHKYGSLPRFCLFLPASIILAVGCIMADHRHSTGFQGLKERKRSHDIDPVAEYCLPDLFWIDTLSCVWNVHDVK